MIHRRCSRYLTASLISKARVRIVKKWSTSDDGHGRTLLYWFAYCQSGAHGWWIGPWALAFNDYDGFGGDW